MGMNPDPLYVEATDDEPWTVPDDPEPRSLTVLRIVTVVLILVVVALVARR